MCHVIPFSQRATRTVALALAPSPPPFKLGFVARQVELTLSLASVFRRRPLYIDNMAGGHHRTSP